MSAQCPLTCSLRSEKLKQEGCLARGFIELNLGPLYQSTILEVCSENWRLRTAPENLMMNEEVYFLIGPDGGKWKEGQKKRK